MQEYIYYKIVVHREGEELSVHTQSWQAIGSLKYKLNDLLKPPISLSISNEAVTGSHYARSNIFKVPQAAGAGPSKKTRGTNSEYLNGTCNHLTAS